MHKKTTVCLFLVVLFSSCCVQAEIMPRSLSTDNRVKVVSYDNNNIVLIMGKYGYQTEIVFGNNETVQNISIGDSLAWQAVPASNHLFIKPVTSSKTNMTVLTDTHNYNFQLDSTSSKFTPTYKLEFIYPEDAYGIQGSPPRAPVFNPDNFNTKYSFIGSPEVVPMAALDNGQFTYFKFKKGQSIPAIFIVDKYKKETLINYHVQGDYLAVNAVSAQFTFRKGNYSACIYNDNLIGDWSKVK